MNFFFFFFLKLSNFLRVLYTYPVLALSSVVEYIKKFICLFSFTITICKLNMFSLTFCDRAGTLYYFLKFFIFFFYYIFYKKYIIA